MCTARLVHVFRSCLVLLRAFSYQTKDFKIRSIRSGQCQSKLQITRNHELGSRVECSAKTTKRAKFHDWWMKSASWRIRSTPSVWFWINLKLRACPFVNAVKIWRWVWLHEAPLNQLIKSGLMLHLLRPFQRNCYPWWKLCKIFRLVCQRLKMLKRFMFRAIIARQCLFRFRLLVFLQDLAGSGGPGFPSNDGGDGFDDEDEELVRDRMPQSFTSHRDLVERDIVDARSLRYATLGYIRSGSIQCFGFQSLEKPVVADHGKVGYQW